MTIRLLRSWNGIPIGTILNSGDAATETALVANGAASFDLSGGNPFVPNDPFSDGITPPGMLYANRPDVLLFNGHEFNFYDIGGGSVRQGGGNKLRSNGVRYKPVNGEAIIDCVDTANQGAQQAAIQSLTPNRVLQPANLFRTFDRFELKGSLSKNGATDSATIRVHFGPLGTQVDPAAWTTTAMLAASRAGALDLRFKLLSNVLMRMEGNQDPASASFTGFSTTVVSAGVAISDISANDMYWTVSVQQSGATDRVTLEDLLIKWQATDSV